MTPCSLVQICRIFKGINVHLESAGNSATSVSLPVPRLHIPEHRQYLYLASSVARNGSVDGKIDCPISMEPTVPGLKLIEARGAQRRQTRVSGGSPWSGATMRVLSCSGS